jgi:hypothetical protein
LSPPETVTIVNADKLLLLGEDRQCGIHKGFELDRNAPVPVSVFGCPRYPAVSDDGGTSLPLEEQEYTIAQLRLLASVESPRLSDGETLVSPSHQPLEFFERPASLRIFCRRLEGDEKRIHVFGFSKR